MRVRATEMKSKTVARKPREDMNVYVEDLLPRGFPVGQQKVDSLAPQAGRPHSGGDLLDGGKESRELIEGHF
jgi:hypothetical protein